MAPRLFVAPSALAPEGDHLRVSGPAYRHLVKVLRLGPGAAVTLFDGRGHEIDAQVETVHADTADLRLGERHLRPPPPVQITLLQAVAKGDRMDWLLQKTTELGVTRICPVITQRVVVRLEPDAAGAKQRRWQTIVQEAARQCGRADVPTVEAPIALAEALARNDAERRLVLWEAQTGPSLVGRLGPEDRNVSLLVGPEGGFGPDEITMAESAGFEAVTLGPRILRTETAAMVAVALVQAAAGGLG